MLQDTSGVRGNRQESFNSSLFLNRNTSDSTMNNYNNNFDQVYNSPTVNNMSNLVEPNSISFSGGASKAVLYTSFFVVLCIVYVCMYVTH